MIFAGLSRNRNTIWMSTVKNSMMKAMAKYPHARAPSRVKLIYMGEAKLAALRVVMRVSNVMAPPPSWASRYSCLSCS